MNHGRRGIRGVLLVDVVHSREISRCSARLQRGGRTQQRNIVVSILPVRTHAPVELGEVVLQVPAVTQHALMEAIERFLPYFHTRGMTLTRQRDGTDNMSDRGVRESVPTAVARP